MSRILKKMAFVAIAVSCSFGMEKDDTEILRENIKLSLIKAYEKPPTEEEIEKALNKIMPYAPQLKLEKEINIIEYSDGQFGDTLCQLRALEWYLRLTSNDVGPLRRFASAYRI